MEPVECYVKQRHSFIMVTLTVPVEPQCKQDAWYLAGHKPQCKQDAWYLARHKPQCKQDAWYPAGHKPQCKQYAWYLVRQNPSVYWLQRAWYFERKLFSRGDAGNRRLVLNKHSVFNLQNKDSLCSMSKLKDGAHQWNRGRGM